MSDLEKVAKSSKTFRDLERSNRCVLCKAPLNANYCLTRFGNLSKAAIFVLPDLVTFLKLPFCPGLLRRNVIFS